MPMPPPLAALFAADFDISITLFALLILLFFHASRITITARYA